MPSVVVATRIVMMSVFAPLGCPVTILVSAQLGVLEQLSVVEALSCHDKGMAETVVCRVFRVRTVAGADTVDDDIVVVWIGRMPPISLSVWRA